LKNLSDNHSKKNETVCSHQFHSKYRPNQDRLQFLFWLMIKGILPYLTR